MWPLALFTTLFAPHSSAPNTVPRVREAPSYNGFPYVSLILDLDYNKTNIMTWLCETYNRTPLDNNSSVPNIGHVDTQSVLASEHVDFLKSTNDTPSLPYPTMNDPHIGSP